jgi:hypothetical protein
MNLSPGYVEGDVSVGIKRAVFFAYVFAFDEGDRGHFIAKAVYFRL